MIGKSVRMTGENIILNESQLKEGIFNLGQGTKETSKNIGYNYQKERKGFILGRHGNGG